MWDSMALFGRLSSSSDRIKSFMPLIFRRCSRTNKYNGLIIYKVPDTPPPKLSSVPEGVSNMFEGGRGSDRGQFDAPTAIAVDPNGNVLIADTGNGRIEKFSPTGTFCLWEQRNRFDNRRTNGIAIDHAGNIYVAEIGSKHRVQKLAPDGKCHRRVERP